MFANRATREWELVRRSIVCLAPHWSHRDRRRPVVRERCAGPRSCVAGSSGGALASRLLGSHAMVGLRDAKRGALVVVCVMAVSSPPGLGTTEASGLAAAEPTIAGVVTDGYHGAAYPVPRHRQPGPHVNDVRVEPLNDSTDRDTPTFLPAGHPVAVRPHEGGGHDQVEVEVSDGVWAVGDRRDFWVIPQFATLGDLTLTLGGQRMSLGQADLVSYPGSLANLDDPRTAEFDAVSFPIRLFLDCTSDDWSIANQKFAGDVLASGIYVDETRTRSTVGWPGSTGASPNESTSRVCSSSTGTATTPVPSRTSVRRITRCSGWNRWVGPCTSSPPHVMPANFERRSIRMSTTSRCSHAS